MRTKLILVSLVSYLATYAQPKVDCAVLFSEFELYHKIEFNKNSIYTSESRANALQELQDILEKCPSYNQEIYTIAEDMYLKLIKPLNVGDEKTNLTNQLVELYGKNSQYFPEKTSENTLKKHILLYSSGIYSQSEALQAFDAFYTSNSKAFSVEALNIYAYLILSENQSNKDVSATYIKKLDAIDYSIHTKISELESKKQMLNAGDVTLKKIDSDLNSLKTSAKNIKSDLKSKKIDCSSWNGIYKEDFDKYKDDVAWIENALSRLEEHRCAANNEFFEAMAKQFYSLKKSVKSAYYMGTIALAKRDKANSVNYFNESAALESNKIEKAKLYYRLADLTRNTDKAQAKKFIDKSIENNPDTIESYILLANLYANADASCFKNDFEKKAIFLLASQTIERAIEVNPKYEASAQKLNKSFLDKAPTKDEIKKSGMKGKSVEFGCWINQSIVVP